MAPTSDGRRMSRRLARAVALLALAAAAATIVAGLRWLPADVAWTSAIGAGALLTVAIGVLGAVRGAPRRPIAPPPPSIAGGPAARRDDRNGPRDRVGERIRVGRADRPAVVDPGSIVREQNVDKVVDEAHHQAAQLISEATARAAALRHDSSAAARARAVRLLALADEATVAIGLIQDEAQRLLEFRSIAQSLLVALAGPPPARERPVAPTTVAATEERIAVRAAGGFPSRRR